MLVFVLIFSGYVALTPDSPIDARSFTIFERMVNSVVVLPGCTGIVLKNNGKDAVVLTAAHCVARFRVQLPNGNDMFLPVPVMADLNKDMSCIGTVGNVSVERDLAVITVSKCKLPTLVAKLAISAPKLGNVVYAVGHPALSNYVLTRGIVSRPEVVMDGVKYMLVSAPIINGNSGGPSFNANGEVVGVNVSIGAIRLRLEDDRPLPIFIGVTHLGIAVPLDEIKAFLKKSGFVDLAK